MDLGCRSISVTTTLEGSLTLTVQVTAPSAKTPPPRPTPSQIGRKLHWSSPDPVPMHGGVGGGERGRGQFPGIISWEVHESVERENERDQRVLLSSPCYEMLMAAVWEKSCC